MKTAKLIIKDIMEELAGRSGSLLHNELEEKIVDEMREAWINIVLTHTASQQAVETDGQKPCKYCENFISSVLLYYCKVCGRKLPAYLKYKRYTFLKGE